MAPSITFALAATAVLVASAHAASGENDVKARQVTRTKVVELGKRGAARRGNASPVPQPSDPCAGYTDFNIQVKGLYDDQSYWVGQTEDMISGVSFPYVDTVRYATAFALDPKTCALSSVSAPGNIYAGTANQLFDYTVTNSDSETHFLAARDVPPGTFRVTCTVTASMDLQCSNNAGDAKTQVCVDKSTKALVFQDPSNPVSGCVPVELALGTAFAPKAPCAGYGSFQIQASEINGTEVAYLSQDETVSIVNVSPIYLATLYTIDEQTCAVSSISYPGSTNAGDANQLFDFIANTPGGDPSRPWLAARTIPASSNAYQSTAVVCVPDATTFLLTCLSLVDGGNSDVCIESSDNGVTQNLYFREAADPNGCTSVSLKIIRA